VLEEDDSVGDKGTHVEGNILRTLRNVPWKFSKGDENSEPFQNIRDLPKTSSFGNESAAVQGSLYDFRGTFHFGYFMVT